MQFKICTGIACVMPALIVASKKVKIHEQKIQMPNISTAFSMMFRRSASFLYDCLLLIALFFVMTAIAIGFNHGEAIQSPAYYLALYVVGFLFFDWFWRHGGQTLGMSAWRIKVEGSQHESLSFKQSLMRYLSGTLLFIFTLFYILLDENNAALHDRLSKTRIVMHYS